MDTASSPNPREVVITGLATAWPSHLITSSDLASYALRFYPENPPWLQSLLNLTTKTHILTRPILPLYQTPPWTPPTPPPPQTLDLAFRTHGIPLALSAARAALAESNTPAESITHLVTVTATHAGCPGYDLDIAAGLALQGTVERVLLSGVGCAGGLAALRVASGLAQGAALRGQQARILVVACEVCSIYFRGELAAAAAAAGDGGQWVNVNPAPALFSDGAAAVVLCNSLALALASRDRDTPGQGKGKGVYAVRDWWSGVTPDTSEEITYRPTESGFLVRLSRDIPHLICNAIRQPFETLLRRNGIEGMEARDFSWAVHPGGLAVIRAVRDALQLDDEDLRATMEVYTRKGNTSSVAVLAVLDEVRKEGGKEDVLACSFGPGVTTEMMLMKRL